MDESIFQVVNALSQNIPEQEKPAQLVISNLIGPMEPWFESDRKHLEFIQPRSGK